MSPKYPALLPEHHKCIITYWFQISVKSKHQCVLSSYLLIPIWFSYHRASLVNWQNKVLSKTNLFSCTVPISAVFFSINNMSVYLSVKVQKLIYTNMYIYLSLTTFSACFLEPEGIILDCKGLLGI